MRKTCFVNMDWVGLQKFTMATNPKRPEVALGKLGA